MKNKTDELLSFAGSDADIKARLSQLYNIDISCAEDIFNFLDENAGLLYGEEGFSIKFDKGSDKKMKQFLSKNASYHVNVKHFTLALVCMLLDRVIPAGLASLLLGFSGNDYSVTKLEGFEKCVAYKIREEKRMNFEQIKQLNLCAGAGINYRCFNRENDKTCQVWNDKKIQDTLSSLISKKIIKERNQFYEIIF